MADINKYFHTEVINDLGNAQHLVKVTFQIVYSDLISDRTIEKSRVDVLKHTEKLLSGIIKNKLYGDIINKVHIVKHLLTKIYSPEYVKELTEIKYKLDDIINIANGEE